MNPRTLHLAAGFLTLSTLTAAAIWAFRSLPSSSFIIPDVTASPGPPPDPPNRRVALDTRPFAIPLWIAPPAPSAPPSVSTPPPPPPPPLRLQLIAIVTEPPPTSGRSVLFYDPDTDKLITLKSGDAIAGRTIEHISTETVTIREPGGNSTRTLALKDEPHLTATSGGSR